jgi:LmbE family N-acetylglucosaminyl deacetylase
MKTPTKAELVSKIEKLEAKVEDDKREYESLRLRYVEKREQLENAAIQDPDNADKYQTVHPDNAHWMSSSDAYITIQMRWNTKLPETYRLEERDENGRFKYKVSPHWEMVKEDEYGQHWHHPEIETDIQMLAEQDFLIEDRDQFGRRQKAEYLEKMNHAIWLAGQIQEFYNGVGQFPDEEVEVQVQFALRGEVGR